MISRWPHDLLTAKTFVAVVNDWSRIFNVCCKCFTWGSYYAYSTRP